MDDGYSPYEHSNRKGQVARPLNHSRSTFISQVKNRAIATNAHALSYGQSKSRNNPPISLTTSRSDLRKPTAKGNHYTSTNSAKRKPLAAHRSVTKGSAPSLTPSRQPNPKASSKPSLGIALMNKRKSKRPAEKQGGLGGGRTGRDVARLLRRDGKSQLSMGQEQDDSGWIGMASPEFGTHVE